MVSLPAPPSAKSSPEPPIRDVVAVTAEEGRPRQGAVGLVQGEVVVAGLAIDEDLVRIGDGRHPPLDCDVALIHDNRSGRVAGDHDRVVPCIAKDPQLAGQVGKRGGHGRQNAAIQPIEAVQLDQPEASRPPPTPAIDVSTIEATVPHEHFPRLGRHGSIADGAR